MLTAGAAGYCKTDVSSALLASGMALIALGEFWVSSSIVHGLAKDMTHADPAAKPVPRRTRSTLGRGAVDAFTKREHTVAQLVAQGHSNREIARALGIGIPTVKGYLTQLFGKTDAGSRVKLALWLWEQLREHEVAARPNLMPGDRMATSDRAFKSPLEERVGQ